MRQKRFELGFNQSNITNLYTTENTQLTKLLINTKPFQVTQQNLNYRYAKEERKLLKNTTKPGTAKKHPLRKLHCNLKRSPDCVDVPRS